MLSLTVAHSPHFWCVPCWDENISETISCHLHWCFQEPSCWKVSEQILLCILMWECCLAVWWAEKSVGHCSSSWLSSGPPDTRITHSHFGSPQSCGSWSLVFVLWPFPADWHWSFMHRIDELLWLTFWDDWIWISLGKNISIFLSSNNALLFQKQLHYQVRSNPVFMWRNWNSQLGKRQNWVFPLISIFCENLRWKCCFCMRCRGHPGHLASHVSQEEETQILSVRRPCPSILV